MENKLKFILIAIIVLMGLYITISEFNNRFLLNGYHEVCLVKDNITVDKYVCMLPCQDMGDMCYCPKSKDRIQNRTKKTINEMVCLQYYLVRDENVSILFRN